MSATEERRTRYGSSVILAGGVRVDVLITVPVSAAYPDQGELAEVAAAGLDRVLTLMSANDGVTVDRARPAPDPWAAPEGRRRADVDTPGQGF